MERFLTAHDLIRYDKIHVSKRGPTSGLTWEQLIMKRSVINGHLSIGALRTQIPIAYVAYKVLAEAIVHR